MLVAVAVLAFNSIRLLVEMCDYTGSASYEAIGKAAFGIGGKIVTILNIFIHTMGGDCFLNYVIISFTQAYVFKLMFKGPV